MIECPKCGKNNYDKSKFCINCGCQLFDLKNFCPNCLTHYSNGGKFCMVCGSKLVNKTIFENNLNKNENTFRSIGVFTPKEIRNKYANINNKFISEGKIASVEEIMDRAGVNYKIVVKDRWYEILENYDVDDNAQLNYSQNVFTPKEIRVKFNSTNKMFISKGKIVSVEEIMDYEGVKYRIIEKNRLYQIFD